MHQLYFNNCMIVSSGGFNSVRLQEYVCKVSHVKQVEFTSSVEQSVIYARHVAQIDLLLLDLNKPELELLHVAILLRKKTRFIIAFGDSQMLALDAFQAGVDNFFLTEHLTLNKFESVMCRLINKDRQRIAPSGLLTQEKGMLKIPQI